MVVSVRGYLLKEIKDVGNTKTGGWSKIMRLHFLWMTRFLELCDAALDDGSVCARNPREGNKRCWQHEGMRLHANSVSSTCYKSECHNTASRYSSFGSVYKDTSHTCGVPLRNGSYCRRRSSSSCWQHRG